MEAQQQLSIENAREGLVVYSTDNPEWGFFRLTTDRNGWVLVRGPGGDSRMLDSAEFRFWTIQPGARAGR